MSTMEPFSKEWCEKAIEVWDDITFPHLVEPETYNYIVEFGETDTGACCQVKADHGKVVSWEPGKTYSDEECDFIIWATRENWKKTGEGKLDPIGGIASKRIHMRKGAMAVAIKEATAFKNLLGTGFGRIPTAW